MDTATLTTTAAEALYLMAKATDELDTSLFEDLFIPARPVQVDVSGHLGLPPQSVLPEQLASQTIQVLSGFTATHHVISNPIITLDQDTTIKAKVTSYKTAYHCIEVDNGEIRSATARGRWDIEMEHFEGRWRITHFTVVRTVPLSPSELGLWDLAKSRMAEGKGRRVKGSKLDV